MRQWQFRCLALRSPGWEHPNNHRRSFRLEALTYTLSLPSRLHHRPVRGHPDLHPNTATTILSSTRFAIVFCDLKRILDDLRKRGRRAPALR